MQINTIVADFVRLSERLNDPSNQRLQKAIDLARHKNPWFVESSVHHAIKGIAHMLQKEHLNQWLRNYSFEDSAPKKIGVVMAGNVPLVGFHDMLSVLASGHKLKAKLSSQDETLMRLVFEELREINSIYEFMIEEVEKIKDVDAVIATGSDNSSRYFEYYFRKIPHIIRKNRTSIAVLNGDESDQDLVHLASDIVLYFGLGCRNVSKLFLPNDFDLTRLSKALIPHEEYLNFHKYRNNYDYNKAILLMKQESFIDLEHLLLVESEELVSPISVCYFSRYSSLNDVSLEISKQSEKIQAIVSQSPLTEKTVPFGKAQTPDLWDYADEVDTMDFLLRKIDEIPSN